MAKFINLTGKRFGKLVVLHRIENRVVKSGASKAQYRAICDCGVEVDITGQSLVNRKFPACNACTPKSGIPKGTRYGKTRHGFVDRRVVLKKGE